MLNFVVRLDINELRHDGHVLSPPLAFVRIYDKYTSRCFKDFLRTMVYDFDARDIYFLYFYLYFPSLHSGWLVSGFVLFIKWPAQMKINEGILTKSDIDRPKHVTCI